MGNSNLPILSISFCFQLFLSIDNFHGCWLVAVHAASCEIIMTKTCHVAIHAGNSEE